MFRSLSNLVSAGLVRVLRYCSLIPTISLCVSVWQLLLEVKLCNIYHLILYFQCNRICGQGFQVRQVVCRAQHNIQNAISDLLPDSRCNHTVRPVSRRECSDGPCSGVEWVVSGWSGVCFNIFYVLLLMYITCAYFAACDVNCSSHNHR